MKYMWDTNILRHYQEGHPRLLSNLRLVSRQDILLPVTVIGEHLRGRSDSITKAEPGQLLRAQELFQQTYNLLNRFQILYFEEKSLAEIARFKTQKNTRKRYADVLIAAQAIAGRYILITRNTKDFRDLLPNSQLQNWVDDKVR